MNLSKPYTIVPNSGKTPEKTPFLTLFFFKKPRMLHYLLSLHQQANRIHRHALASYQLETPAVVFPASGSEGIDFYKVWLEFKKMRFGTTNICRMLISPSFIHSL